jgi:hypothetical protein
MAVSMERPVNERTITDEEIDAMYERLKPGMRYLNRPMTDADRRVEYEPYLNDDPRDRKPK